MGLSTWKNAPNGRILTSDVTISKNYLPEKEIKKLERTISSQNRFKLSLRKH